MTSREFAYWLQGYFEISGGSGDLRFDQVELIQKHLAMVFIHEIDPSYPKEQQTELNKAHFTQPMSKPVSETILRC